MPLIFLSAPSREPTQAWAWSSTCTGFIGHLHQRGHPKEVKSNVIAFDHTKHLLNEVQHQVLLGTHVEKLEPVSKPLTGPLPARSRDEGPWNQLLFRTSYDPE